jgi:hypothetical protein
MYYYKGDIAQSVVTFYGMDDHRSIHGRGRNLSLCHHIQTESGTQTTRRPVCIGGCFPGLKWRKCEAYHSLQCNDDQVETAWSRTTTATNPKVYMMQRLGTGKLYILLSI